MMRKILFTYTYSIMLFCFLSIPSAFAEDFDLRNTFAVVWTIDTDDAKLYNDSIPDQAAKTLELWQNGIVENVYLDSKKTYAEVNKGDTARVMFFIKAKTDEEARKILDEMPLVKNKMAIYTLFPVGILWLKQF